MGFLSRVHRTRRYAGDFDDGGFWTGSTPSYMFSGFSQAGIRVTPEIAMTVSAVFFGTSFLSRIIGSLPCGMLQYTGPTSKQPAPSHPLASVLGLTPNITQDAMQWVEQGIGHLALRGNWYNKILSGPRGFVDQLIPVHPDLVRVGRLPSGRLQYRISRLGGQPADILTQDEMFHVRGYSTDGIHGLSMIAYGANSLGVAIAQDTFTGRFFKSGAAAALSASHPGVLGEEGTKNLRQSINAYLTGLENAGGILILEEGVKLDKIGISPNDANLLGMKDHSIREVARWFGLPSYLFSDMGKPPTYASSVQFAEDLVRYSFGPLTRRIEIAIRNQLILQPELFEAAFNMDELRKGDLLARYQAYHLAILDGWMSRNEARIEENLNPEPDLDEFWQPLNVQEAGADPIVPPPPPPQLPPADPEPEARHSVRATVLAFESASRVVRKEIAQVTKGAKDHAKDPAAWSAWLQQYYGTEHPAFVAETLHLPLSLTKEYCARQGLQLQNVGVTVLEDFEATCAPELATWALEGSRRIA